MKNGIDSLILHRNDLKSTGWDFTRERAKRLTVAVVSAALACCPFRPIPLYITKTNTDYVNEDSLLIENPIPEKTQLL